MFYAPTEKMQIENFRIAGTKTILNLEEDSQ